MTPKEFYDGPAHDMLKRAEAIMRPKMVDYAGNERFSENFHRTAERTGLTPFQVWGVFADKHWGAVMAYVKNGKTESEDIRDRIADLVNYLLLLSGLISESESEVAPKEKFI